MKYFRKELPQISDELKSFLINSGFATQCKIMCNRLRPSQRDFDISKMMAKYQVETDRVIVVSADNWIIDGHHSWVVHDWELPIKTIRMKQDLPNSINFINSLL